MITSRKSGGSPLPFEIDTNVESSVFGLTPNILPVRCDPLPDELLSSWLVRLAWLNAEKLHTFRRRFWPSPGSPWGRNIDLGLSGDVLRRIAEMSLRTIESLSNHLLTQYSGILFEGANPKNATDGVLVSRHRGTNVSGYGIQLCPECMSEGAVPYFRCSWKVSYLVICSRHRRLLLDACPNCGSQLTYHLADFGQSLLPEQIPTSFCASCRLPWSSACEIPGVEVEDEFCEWQAQLCHALATGWLTGTKSQPLFALSFFNGLRILVRLVGATDTRGAQLREQVSSRIGLLPLAVTHSKKGSVFSGLRLGDRLYLLRLAHWLLQSWPERFLSAATAAGLRISYIDSYRRRTQIPYWLASVLDLTRDPRHAKISAGERESVRRFLERHGRLATINATNRWLGRWYVSRRKVDWARWD